MLDLLDAALVQHPALIEHRQTIADVLDEVDVVFDDDQRTLRLIGRSSSPVTRRSSGLIPPVGSSSRSSFGRQRQRHGDFEPLLLTMT